MKMSARRGIVLGPVLGIALAVWNAGAGLAQEARKIAPPESLEAWMPDSVSGYLALRGLGSGLESYLRSDARKEIESMQAVQFAMSQPPYRDFQEGLEEFRTATGKDPLQMFKDFLGQEVLIGFQGQGWDRAVVFLTRGAGEKELEGALQAIRQALASKIGYTPEGYKSSREGFQIESIGEASFATLGSVWAISNRASLVESVVDLAAGKSKASVRSHAGFQKAAGACGRDALASLAVRTKDIPNFRIPGKLDNALGSLIAGGLLGSLEGSDMIAATLRVGRGGLDLQVSSILPEGKVAEKYRSFFPGASPDAIAPRLARRGVLTLGQLHRDLQGWWSKREDLLVPSALADLAQFSQVVSVFFGGRSFEGEILPELGTRITLVALNQAYPGLAEKPSPAIPAFAGIFEVPNAPAHQMHIDGAFQTLIGMVNSDQAQKHPDRPLPFAIKTEKAGGVEFQTAAPNLPKDGKPGIEANFTPSVAVVGNRVVLSSSAELARILMEELGDDKAGTAAPAAPARDSLFVDSEALASIISQNLEAIVSDNMRKKGISRDQAEGEMGAVLEILKRLRDLTAESWNEGGAVHMTLKLRHRLGKTQSVKADRMPGEELEQL